MKQTQPLRIQLSIPRLLAAVLAVGTMLIGVLLLGLGAGFLGKSISLDPNARVSESGVLLLLLGASVLVWTLRRQNARAGTGTLWGTRLTGALMAWNERDDALSVPQRAIVLGLVSVLGLFLELVLIRLLGSEIKVFAFLKNVVLIGAFLGLGMGFFLARRRVGLMPLFLPGAAALSATVVVGGASGMLTKTVLPGGDQLVLLGLSVRTFQAVPVLVQALTWIPYYLITLFYFVGVVLVFIPLGQYTGKSMRAFAPIPAYSLNLAGSLAGTLLFALVSFLWLPPLIWFWVVALQQIGDKPNDGAGFEGSAISMGLSTRRRRILLSRPGESFR